MSTTKKVNKYNVKAIRKELDSCVRSHAWKRFRTVLKSCCPPSCFCDELCDSYCKDADEGSVARSDEQTGTAPADEADTSLLEAIVMDRPRSTRGTPSSHPTLIHALIDKINSGSCTNKSGYGRRSANQLPPPYDIIDVISRYVPKALLVQDGKNGRTPLHLAISRNACPSIIESLIQNDRSKKSLQMVDKRNDTPIICYIKTADVLDFDEGGIGNLLLRDEKGAKELIHRVGPKGKAPVFYVAAKELREAGLLRLLPSNDDVRIPDTLRHVLVRTYNFLADNKRRNSPYAHAASSHFLPSKFDIESNVGVPLLHVFASAVSSSFLFDELSGPIFAIILREMEQELKLLKSEGKPELIMDENGNTPLHLLALHHDTFEYFATELPQTTSGKLHSTLIARCPEYLRLPNKEGNLPLHLAFYQKIGDLITDFCDAYPGGTMHRNFNGELPLHVFLKRVGLPVPIIWRRNLMLEQLLKAGPDTVAMTDSPTGLYPFQLAVEAAFFSPADENYHINLAFELLRKQPDLCSSALQGEDR